MTTREAYSKEEYERLERDIVGHSTISPSEASVLRAALRIASLLTEENIRDAIHGYLDFDQPPHPKTTDGMVAALLSKLTGSEPVGGG